MLYFLLESPLFLSLSQCGSCFFFFLGNVIHAWTWIGIESWCIVSNYLLQKIDAGAWMWFFFFFVFSEYATNPDTYMQKFLWANFWMSINMNSLIAIDFVFQVWLCHACHGKVVWFTLYIANIYGQPCELKLEKRFFNMYCWFNRLRTIIGTMEWCSCSSWLYKL